MSQAAPAITRAPAEVVRKTPVSQAPNGICYAVSGELVISENDLERMVAAVPKAAAGALSRKAYISFRLPSTREKTPSLQTAMTLRSATTQCAIATSILATRNAFLFRLD